MEWSDEVIRLLRSLWEEGHSTAEIGRRLGVTKNAIVGKAHRLDLTARPSPIRRDPSVADLQRKQSVRRIDGPTLPPLPSVVADAEAVIAALNVAQIQIETARLAVEELVATALVDPSQAQIDLKAATPPPPDPAPTSLVPPVSTLGANGQADAAPGRSDQDDPASFGAAPGAVDQNAPAAFGLAAGGFEQDDPAQAGSTLDGSDQPPRTLTYPVMSGPVTGHDDAGAEGQSFVRSISDGNGPPPVVASAHGCSGENVSETLGSALSGFDQNGQASEGSGLDDPALPGSAPGRPDENVPATYGPALSDLDQNGPGPSDFGLNDTALFDSAPGIPDENVLDTSGSAPSGFDQNGQASANSAPGDFDQNGAAPPGSVPSGAGLNVPSLAGPDQNVVQGGSDENDQVLAGSAPPGGTRQSSPAPVISAAVVPALTRSAPARVAPPVLSRSPSLAPRPVVTAHRAMPGLPPRAVPVPPRPPGRVVTCCWPIGEPGTSDFHFCDVPSEPGRPYCEEHVKIAYVKVRDRRDDAA